MLDNFHSYPLQLLQDPFHYTVLGGTRMMDRGGCGREERTVSGRIERGEECEAADRAGGNFVIETCRRFPLVGL